jgi:hypothetical protein
LVSSNHTGLLSPPQLGSGPCKTWWQL